MKKIKMFESYEEKEFTEEQMLHALEMMTGWLLSIFAEEHEPEMTPEEKANEIVDYLKSGKMQFGVKGFRQPWKKVSFTKVPDTWQTTLTLRK